MGERRDERGKIVSRKRGRKRERRGSYEGRRGDEVREREGAGRESGEGGGKGERGEEE